jgi:hypothetical protein
MDSRKDAQRFRKVPQRLGITCRFKHNACAVASAQAQRRKGSQRTQFEFSFVSIVFRVSGNKYLFTHSSVSLCETFGSHAVAFVVKHRE